jgi:ankyrin repeat protein
MVFGSQRQTHRPQSNRCEICSAVPPLFTALNLALSKGYSSLAETILGTKVDLESSYGNSETALIQFCCIKDVGLVRRAIALGAAVNAIDSQKKSALIWAGKSDPSSTTIPKILLEHGANTTLTDRSEKQAIDYAESPALVELLGSK